MYKYYTSYNFVNYITIKNANRTTIPTKTHIIIGYLG